MAGLSDWSGPTLGSAVDRPCSLHWNQVNPASMEIKKDARPNAKCVVYRKLVPKTGGGAGELHLQWDQWERSLM